MSDWPLFAREKITFRAGTANDVGGTHFVTQAEYCPNDKLGSGIFLTDLLARTFLKDQHGNEYGCHTNISGSNPGDLYASTVPSLTAAHDYDAYNGTTKNCVGTVLATLHSYDASGNLLTTTDPDGHLGCTSGSAQYSACATYDSTYQTHLLTAANAKNQTTTSSYDSSASGGFGEWLISETDPSSCTGSTYAVSFYDGYNNSGTPGATFPSGCSAPSGSYASDPIGHETAEVFVGGSGAGSGWRCFGYDGRGRTDHAGGQRERRPGRPGRHPTTGPGRRGYGRMSL